MNNNKKIVVEKAVIDGREISFEVGRFANQATASVVGRLGDTVVLVTVVGGKERSDISWFPLQVEFQEKLYAGGKIKGSRWVKREGRPSDQAVLTSRVIDRSIRPLFTDGYKGEVQVVITPLSVDEENDADVLSISTVSAALSISGLPWEGPLAGARIGLVDGEYIVNPTYEQRENSKMDLVVSSSRDAVIMVEAGANEASEDEILKALSIVQEKNRAVVEAIERLKDKVGKPIIEIEETVSLSDDIKQKLDELSSPVIKELLTSEKAGKINKEPLYAIVDQILELEEIEDIKKTVLSTYLEKAFKQAARDQVIDTKKRLDGRDLTQIRPLSADVGLLPRTHGSGLFQRGETQVLNLTTLASPRFNQTIELMDQEIDKRYMHHYVFPPYSVGETGRIGFAGRREIGHGALAERALLPVLPSEDEFPYAMRLVSECLSSNGSTSQASICASTLSLMDAGVPIKKPVAGIAMGLMVKNPDKGIVEGEYVVLTDIQGLEDHIGDMDFKVAGTCDGITALQMDIKVKGVTMKILSQALNQAKTARIEILEVMNKAISKPRSSVSQYAPKIHTIFIKPEQIGEVIGSGGKIIKTIQEETGVDVDISDEGRVVITAVDAEAVKKATDWIEGITREITVGEVFTEAKVISVVDFGAFVEILPGREGLVHVSEMSTGYIGNPSEILSEGQIISVTVIKVDPDEGKIGLSLLTSEERQQQQEKRNNRDRHSNHKNGSYRNNNRFGNNRTSKRNERKPRY